jgi:hypothetical protein
MSENRQSGKLKRVIECKPDIKCGVVWSCKLDCGHTVTSEYHKDRPPKRLSCQKCKEERR